MSESKQLTVVERASIALGASEIEKKLIELANLSTEITKITNTAGREQCHAALMVLKVERIVLEKLGKAARDDATKFSKAVIAEEDRLINLIAPEEKRLTALRDGWDAAREAEKQAKIKAEMERVANIKKKIGVLREEVALLTGAASYAIADRLSRLCSEIPDKKIYEEFLEEATAVHSQAVKNLENLFEVTLEQEVLANRLKQERAELEKLRAEQQYREAEELQRRAAENARIDAERKAEEASIKAKRDEEEALIAITRKAEQEKRDEEERRLQAERHALAKEREAIEQEKAKREQAVLMAKRIEEETEQIRNLPKIVEKKDRPDDDEIIDILAAHFNVHVRVIIGWLMDIDLDSATDRIVDVV